MPAPGQQLYLLAPPYRDIEPITEDWRPSVLPPRGRAIVWFLEMSAAGTAPLDWLRSRPHGLPLIVVLPEPEQIQDCLPLLRQLPALRPKAVIPAGELASPKGLRSTLAAPPTDLGKAVIGYLTRRGILESSAIREETRRIFQHALHARSVSALSQRLYTSRRTLGRHYASHGLPVPSHWLQAARLLHAAVHLQNDRGTVFRVACRIGYPDGFTMSNQMKRLLGCRPTDVREHLGWEWLVENWLKLEATYGGLDHERYQPVISMYLCRPDGDNYHR